MPHAAVATPDRPAGRCYGSRTNATDSALSPLSSARSTAATAGAPTAPQPQGRRCSRPRSSSSSALFVLVAMPGFVGVVGAAFVYSQDLKHPRQLERDRLPGGHHHLRPQRQHPGHGCHRVASSAGPSAGTGVPAHLADAVTAVEDKTFWANTGIDPIGIVASAIDTLHAAMPRGGSTITQQLVRQKLLPDEVIAESSRLGDRKIKEIIQSIRVTDYYRGEQGKQAILTAYLNQNFYGNNSYGVRAAAMSYFGKSRPRGADARAGGHAGGHPTGALDLRPGAQRGQERRRTSWEVPADAAIYSGATSCSQLLADDPTRRVLSGDTYIDPGLPRGHGRAAGHRRPDGQPAWKAPHFVWYVRDELRELLCAESRDLRQARARAACASPPRSTSSVQQQGREVGRGHGPAARTAATPPARPGSWACPTPTWMARLRTQNVWNAALSAIDYQTGEIIAYVGSANYYERAKVNKKMQPQYDVLSHGWRQSGSTFKPFTYATGINNRTLTAASMFMDVTTDFGGYTPTDFNGLRAWAAARSQCPPVLAQRAGREGPRHRGRETGLQQVEGLRHGLPAVVLARSVDGAGHARGASPRPQPGLRHHGQRWRERGPYLDPRGHQRQQQQRLPSTSTRRPRASTSSVSRPPTW